MVYVGIDIGGTGIQVGVVTEAGDILAKGGIVTDHSKTAEQTIADIADCVKKTLDAGSFAEEEVAAVGAGIPGIVDPRTGHVPFCTNLGWVDVDFVSEFRKHLEKPVFLANDATVAGLAESKIGVTANTTSSVFITLGTGVGGGIVIGGKPWSGHHGVGSEIGHMIIELDGEPCTCGNRGCLERYCSATAIIRMARERVLENPASAMFAACEGDPAKMNAKIVFDCAKEGDPEAESLFRRYVSYLGRAIANIVQFMDPEVIALGGGVSKAGDFLVNAVRQEVPKYLLYKTMPFPEIKIARLGPDAGIIGAAMLALV